MSAGVNLWETRSDFPKNIREMDEAAISSLKQRYVKAGQGHVFDNYLDGGSNGVNSADREAFIAQLRSIDPDEATRAFVDAMAAVHAASDAGELQPLAAGPEGLFVSAADLSPSERAHLRQAGLGAIVRGEVAVVILAGGQATRLGADVPAKGEFDDGMPSHATLFEVFCDRITRLRHLAAAEAGSHGSGGGAPLPSLPLYVMTSDATDAETRSFFASNGYFGLPCEDVSFFRQGSMPCFDRGGKMLLKAPLKLAAAPDGNGGLFRALARSGTLSDMRRRGVMGVHVSTVDNILCRVADPLFVGLCLRGGGAGGGGGGGAGGSEGMGASGGGDGTTYGASSGHARTSLGGFSGDGAGGGIVHVGSKVVRKTDPHESVGLLALRGGALTAIEYSELPPAAAEATVDDASPGASGATSSGSGGGASSALGRRLRFDSGNACIHWFSVDFCEAAAAASMSTAADADGLTLPDGSSSRPHGGIAGDPRNPFTWRLPRLRYHPAFKYIPRWDPASSRTLRKADLEALGPQEGQGVKLESLAFDTFPYAPLTSALVLEVDRSEEFAPIKNAPGSAADTPESARALVSALHHRWLQAAGASITGPPDARVEVHPLVSYAGEGLESVAGATLRAPLLVAPDTLGSNSAATACAGGSTATGGVRGAVSGRDRTFIHTHVVSSGVTLVPMHTRERATAGSSGGSGKAAGGTKARMVGPGATVPAAGAQKLKGA